MLQVFCKSGLQKNLFQPHAMTGGATADEADIPAAQRSTHAKSSSAQRGRHMFEIYNIF